MVAGVGTIRTKCEGSHFVVAGVGTIRTRCEGSHFAVAGVGTIRIRCFNVCCFCFSMCVAFVFCFPYSFFMNAVLFF